MATTLFSTSDGGTPKLWSNKAWQETYGESFFLPRFVGGEESDMPVIAREDLESGPGDEVTVYLTAKLGGKAREGEEKQEGFEERLSDYTDKVRIDRMRKPVNIGHIMAQKRRPYDLKKLAVRQLGKYWGEYFDQLIMVHASGQRGTGENIEHLPFDYVGFPHALIPPDADHVLYPNAVTTEAGLTVADVMSREFIERAVLKADTMVGGKTKKFKMNPVSTEGGKHWVLVMHPSQMFDLRFEVGEAGWLNLERSALTAVGRNSPIFKGARQATALLNGTVLHTHNSVTYRSNYGAGGNVRGYRALFLGAGAVTMAWGTEDKSANGVRMKLGEYDVDGGDERVVKSLVVAGIKKTRFENRDYGVLSLDSSASVKAQTAQSS